MSDKKKTTNEDPRSNEKGTKTVPLRDEASGQFATTQPQGTPTIINFETGEKVVFEDVTAEMFAELSEDSDQEAPKPTPTPKP
jgi:hypothetical protein